MKKNNNNNNNNNNKNNNGNKNSKNNNNSNQQKVVKKSNPPQQINKNQSKQLQPQKIVAQTKSSQPKSTKPSQPSQPQPQQKKALKKEPIQQDEDIEESIQQDKDEELSSNNPLGIDSELYEDITKIQLEIDNIGNKEMQHKLKLDIERDRALTPLYNEREKILVSLPDFWCKVITTHPILSALFTGKDQDLIKNVTGFKVDIMDSGNVRFNFTFKNNNFIKNKTIWKEYAFEDNGISTTCSPIQWKNGNDITKKKEGDEPSFFSWFADQDDLEIFDILKHEIWMFPNEIYYSN